MVELKSFWRITKVCETFIRRFDSAPRLQFPSNNLQILIGYEASFSGSFVPPRSLKRGEEISQRPGDGGGGEAKPATTAPPKQ